MIDTEVEEFNGPICSLYQIASSNLLLSCVIFAFVITVYECGLGVSAVQKVAVVKHCSGSR